EDEVEFTCCLTGTDSNDGNDGLLVLARDDESMRQLRGAARADEKGHVSSCSRQSTAKIAANTACPDDQRSHVRCIIPETLHRSQTGAAARQSLPLTWAASAGYREGEHRLHRRWHWRAPQRSALVPPPRCQETACRAG